MNWNKKVRHFGDIKEGETLSFVFEYTGSNIIDKVSTSCGCINASCKGTKVIVKWKPRPNELEGHYEASKSIAVFYKDGKTENLYVKAIVYEDL